MNVITRTPRRVQHQNGLRLAQVVCVDPISPRMRRLTFGGPELKGFTSAAADDHIRIFLPAPGHKMPVLPTLGPDGPVFASGAASPIMRDYTPRRFNPIAGELTVEFVVHGDGPAAYWAGHAKPGDWIGIGGPRGSLIVPDDYDAYLLMGDETALPAIARHLEEMRQGTMVRALIEVADQREERHLPTAANAEITWLFRNGAPPGMSSLLEGALKSLRLPSGDTHAWIAGEIEVARALRQHLLDERGFIRAQIKAAGYWRHGETSAYGRIED